jgi:hypothetical protein
VYRRHGESLAGPDRVPWWQGDAGDGGAPMMPEGAGGTGEG